MATEGGWRENLFQKNQQYRVLKNWSQQGSTFLVNTTVVYDSCGYERYDGQSMFRFYNKEKEELIWKIHDEEPDSKAKEYFSEI